MTLTTSPGIAKDTKIFKAANGRQCGKLDPRWPGLDLYSKLEVDVNVIVEVTHFHGMIPVLDTIFEGVGSGFSLEVN